LKIVFETFQKPARTTFWLLSIHIFINNRCELFFLFQLFPFFCYLHFLTPHFTIYLALICEGIMSGGNVSDTNCSPYGRFSNLPNSKLSSSSMIKSGFMSDTAGDSTSRFFKREYEFDSTSNDSRELHS